MRAWSSLCARRRRAKQLSRATLIHDVEPDAILLQELRVHYFPSNEDPTAFSGFPPRDLGGYNAVAWDPLMKTCIYVHARHTAVCEIRIPSSTFTTMIADGEDHH